jgi:hypothetical protein
MDELTQGVVNVPKLICPKCNSQEITFGKDFLCYYYWRQTTTCSTYFYEYEQGDSPEEGPNKFKIECFCNDCNHLWWIEGSVHDYLDG